MSKYDPLGEHLAAQEFDRIPMTFSEIESVIDAELPPSSRYRAWWSNNPTNSVMTKAWLKAGFKTENVDMASEKLVFCRTADNGDVPGGGSIPPNALKKSHHPLFGSMKGTVTIPEGVDITEPADPDWGSRY